MPAKWFICPDNQRIEIAECLKEGGCRMSSRCATRSYLRMACSERPWTGKPSTTQLIAGTMLSYLRLTKDYSIRPDDRAFMIHGTNAHQKLEDCGTGDECSLLEQKFDGEDTPVTGIMDVCEFENGGAILVDNKTSGSYKVQKALGFYVVDEPTGEYYKSGKKKGQEKTRKVLKRDDAMMDMWEWELQLNNYRIELEKRGHRIDEMRIQCVVRDGNTWIARSRGVFHNLYYFLIKRLPDEEVVAYFEKKRTALLSALENGWNKPCQAAENWDGIRCSRYCEVAEYCPLGKYLRIEREELEMPIKGLSDVRRLPRLGRIALGIKKKSAKGIEYPSEVDYFILKPNTPSELENERLIQEFKRLYGDEPKQINIMLPLPDPDDVFPQWYKRYGSSTMLQCKGDGEKAVCIDEEHAKGLKIPERYMPIEHGIEVECLGQECPYYKAKKCKEVATLQLLLPELEGAGVWQLTTSSFHSIVNINSSLDYIRAMAGRFNMIPLTLERRAQEIQHEDEKGKKTKNTHFILHINMQIALAELQRYAQIDATKVLLELPAVEESKEDIYFEQTPAYNGNGRVVVEHATTIEEIAEKLAKKLSAEKVNGFSVINVSTDDIIEFASLQAGDEDKLLHMLSGTLNEPEIYKTFVSGLGGYLEMKIQALGNELPGIPSSEPRNPQHLTPDEMPK